MFAFTLTLMILGLSSIAGAQNYCNLQSCKGKPHTMCKFANAPAPACGVLQSSWLTLQEKDTLLQLHNYYRQLVASGRETRGSPGPQPPAASMPNLIWDDELEIVAQRWAFQCKFGHDSCRNVGRFRVGQNVVQKWSSEPIPTGFKALVDLWYDEVKLYNRNNVQNFRSHPPTGHYTQMVWANTTTLGCGMVRYIDNSKQHGNVPIYTQYLVCNYGPAGNIIGYPVYINRKVIGKKYRG